MESQTESTSTRAQAKSDRRPYTAHDLLGEVLRDYPNATEPKLRAVFTSLARDSDQIATQIIGAWFDRYRSRHRYDSEAEQQRRDRREEQQQRAQARAIEARELANTVKEIILLDMVTPSGKKLRDLTGRECGGLGGWFAKLADKVKPTQKVGSVFTETALRELWQQ